MSETELSKEDAVTKKDNEEQVKKALLDPTKKRKAEDEIEIDLKSSIPLSKKQKRLLRRGKVTLEELNAKYNIDPKSIEEYKEDAEKKSLVLLRKTPRVKNLQLTLQQEMNLARL